MVAEVNIIGANNPEKKPIILKNVECKDTTPTLDKKLDSLSISFIPIFIPPTAPIIDPLIIVNSG